jgi:hypothetical protein
MRGRFVIVLKISLYRARRVHSAMLMGGENDHNERKEKRKTLQTVLTCSSVQKENPTRTRKTLNLDLSRGSLRQLCTTYECIYGSSSSMALQPISGLGLLL